MKVKRKESRATWAQSTFLQPTNFVISNKLHILPVSQFLLKLWGLKIPIECSEQNLAHDKIYGSVGYDYSLEDSPRLFLISL